MDILVFSWRDPEHPQAGGAEQVMHEHMKGWIDAGNKVTLFSSNFNGAKDNSEIDGVNIIRRGNQILGVQIAAFFWYLFTNKKKFGLVVDQFHGIPFFTPVYIRGPKLAVVQEVAREVWLNNDLKFPLNKIIGWIGYLMEPLIFNFYKRVSFMTGSESAKEDLIGMGIRSQNITVVPHGTLIDKPKPMPKKNKKKTVVFLGALARDKGIEDAIETFAILDKGGKYNYWIIGKGNEDYVKELKKKVANLKLKSKPKFWGFVSQKKKFELLAKSHVMINPSLLEGFGLVNIEANAMGTPVVGYKSRGLVDSIKDGKSGFLVDNNSPQSLAESAKKLLSEKKLYYRLSKGAISWSKQFTWDKSRKKSLRLLESIN